MTAVDLEISLRPAGSHFAVEARCDLPGSDVARRASATVEIDLARLQALTLDTMAYGLALGQMLLVGDIARTFAQASAVAQQRLLPLRLRLALPADAADLHELRWETLRDPAQPDTPLLTTGTQVLFSRYLSSNDWQPVALPLKDSLRALVVLSSPADLDAYGLHPLNLEVERSLAEASFGPIPITMLGRGQASLNEITQRLCEGYNILYLLAHGRTDDAGETWVYLEGTDGQTEAVPGSALVTRITELRERPRLIILGSCESAGDLLTLGPWLAQAGVPAVLAMQGRITLETLRAFLSATLRALQRDGLIDQAVTLGRGAVRERPDFWVPVLFLRSQSGRLWLLNTLHRVDEHQNPLPYEQLQSDNARSLEITENSPLLMGLIIDLSYSTLETIVSLPKKMGISKERLSDMINLIISRSIAFCKTPEADEVLPLLSLFIYGFGFGSIRSAFANTLSQIGIKLRRSNPNIIPSEDVRDMFAEIATKEHLPLTPSVSDLHLHSQYYRQSIEAQFLDVGLGPSILYKALYKAKERMFQEAEKPYYKNPLLIIISDGNLEGATDEELYQIAQEIKNIGVQIVCLYIGAKNIVESKKLYSSPKKVWSLNARRLFKISSTVSNDVEILRSIMQISKEKGWDISDNSHLFIQINQSEMIEESVDIILNPIKKVSYE